MNKLLHIVATPRGQESRTLKASQEFLHAFAAKHPSCAVEEVNVFKIELPPLSAKNVEGKYVLMGGIDLTGKLKHTWHEIEYHIHHFMSADAYLVSTPMWNFGIPYPLKHYIDVIVQPKYLFRYTPSGPEGLAKNKKMAVITSRGGDYSAGSPAHAYDQQEPYLKTVFGFVGITDIRFVHAQPMDAGGAETQRIKLDEAKEAARLLGEKF
ncbi:MAG TPA: NAD(P)H-dependent oxidoreductase [bacterium]|nr:NAD(P)H-dependent oxidoreductase [bacterium]